MFSAYMYLFFVESLTGVPPCSWREKAARLSPIPFVVFCYRNSCMWLSVAWIESLLTCESFFASFFSAPRARASSVSARHFWCRFCGHSWKARLKKGKGSFSMSCPILASKGVLYLLCTPSLRPAWLNSN